MCVVVDPPILIPMTKSSHADFDDFSPVTKWVVSGDGKLVLGGSTYKEQLSKVASVLNFVHELERAGKIVRREDALVDAEEKILRESEPAKDFDDAHLIALVRLTKCRVVCVKDMRSHRYLKDDKLFGSEARKPKIYSSADHSNLLSANNIVACCRPKSLQKGSSNLRRGKGRRE